MLSRILTALWVWQSFVVATPNLIRCWATPIQVLFLYVLMGQQGTYRKMRTRNVKPLFASVPGTMKSVRCSGDEYREILQIYFLNGPLISHQYSIDFGTCAVERRSSHLHDSLYIR